MAQFVETHPAMARVNYPRLKTHPDHARASELFDGFGGMMSLEMKGGLVAAEEFLRKAILPIQALSLGGVEALMTHPAVTSHAGIRAEERRAIGISEP